MTTGNGLLHTEISHFRIGYNMLAHEARACCVIFVYNVGRYTTFVWYIYVYPSGLFHLHVEPHKTMEYIFNGD